MKRSRKAAALLLVWAVMLCGCKHTKGILPEELVLANSHEALMTLFGEPTGETDMGGSIRSTFDVKLCGIDGTLTVLRHYDLGDANGAIISRIWSYKTASTKVYEKNLDVLIQGVTDAFGMPDTVAEEDFYCLYVWSGKMGAIDGLIEVSGQLSATAYETKVWF